MTLTAQDRLAAIVQARKKLYSARDRLVAAKRDLKETDAYKEQQLAKEQVKLYGEELEEMLDETVQLVQYRLLDLTPAGDTVSLVDRETGEVLGAAAR